MILPCRILLLMPLYCAGGIVPPEWKTSVSMNSAVSMNSGVFMLICCREASSIFIYLFIYFFNCFFLCVCVYIFICVYIYIFVVCVYIYIFVVVVDEGTSKVLS